MVTTTMAATMITATTADLDRMTVAELGELISRSFDALARRSGPEAFAALTGSAATLGLAMGTASAGWAADPAGDEDTGPRALATPTALAPAAPGSLVTAGPATPAETPRTAGLSATLSSMRSRPVPSTALPSTLVPPGVAAPVPGPADMLRPDPPATTMPARRSRRWRPRASTVAAEPPTTAIPMTVFGIHEPRPGTQWQELFRATWDAYRRWYLSEGTAARPDPDTAAAMLRRHMPELVPTWERLVELTGGDELAARMLTLWNAPRFLPGCSQAVLTRPTPVLIRNYDYGLDLFERVVYSSEFTQRKVLGTGDCLWGLLDGMNDAGLAVSLAFGGRRGSGPGFGIPLVVRYLLEVAATTAEVRAILARLPISMSYNLTVVDAAGQTLTAYVAPGVPPEFSSSRVATNHRGTTPDDPAHAARFRSVERRQHLDQLLAGGPGADTLAADFLRPPLYTTAYSRAFGTLYTAVYRPAEAAVDYRWPEDQWRRTFDSPSATKTVVLREPR